MSRREASLSVAGDTAAGSLDMMGKKGVECKVPWTKLRKAELHQNKILVLAVLQSPSNLFTCGKGETPVCPLGQKSGTPEHFLCCCPRALGKGHYRWRHDQILKVIVDSICSGISLCPVKKNIPFIIAGEKSIASIWNPSSVLLATACDWGLKVDLRRQLKSPETVIKTVLRPDITLISVAEKQVVVLELNVP